jgi:Ion channel
MPVVYALAGALLVLAILAEAFEALVLPRRVMRRMRFSRLYYRTGWRVWTAVADWLRSGPRRETALSIFGPLSLFGLFAIWAAGLILGFGLLQQAVAPRDGGIADSVYFSGTTFTTLGYGDLAPVGPVSRVLAVIEAATGFGFFAVVIAYLPVLYQAFGRRESLIALLDARAGSPPNAGRALIRLAPGTGEGAVLSRLLDESEKWAAEVLEAQLSFPVLGFYRSQHDNQSWLAAMTCMLDLTALLLTVVDAADRQQAKVTFAMCRHALVDLSLVLRRPPRDGADRLPDARLGELLKVLKEAGVAVREDAGARERLASLRGLYEPFSMALAKHFRLFLPDVWAEGDKKDNWQTSAWVRWTDSLNTLGNDPADEHFG